MTLARISKNRMNLIKIVTRKLTADLNSDAGEMNHRASLRICHEIASHERR